MTTGNFQSTMFSKFFVFDVTVCPQCARYLGEQFFFSSPKFCITSRFRVVLPVLLFGALVFRALLVALL